MQRIESVDNKKIKRLISLRQKKVRLKESLFLMEGIKAVDEAVSAEIVLDMMLISESFFENNSGLIKKYEEKEQNIYIVKDYIFNKCSALKTPQGILASVKILPADLSEILKCGKPLVVLDGINDPGNIGTIIRTADAFMFGGVLLLPGCADVYNPKTVQASVGSINRISCIECTQDELDALSEAGYKLFGMDLNGESLQNSEFQSDKTAVVIGSESHGLGRDTISKCFKLLKIPIPGGAESLNASIAAGIIMNRISAETSSLK